MVSSKVEICIDASSLDAVRDAVEAAYVGGAATVELCAAMDVDGLTPDIGLIAKARQVFGDRKGLMVMIRPRAGNFAYSATELALMQQQIAAAANAGADGVVFGALHPADNRVDMNAMRALISPAHAHGLTTTFHRAFDATPSPGEAMDAVLQLGCQRVLTCGMPWDQPGSALDGVRTLAQLVQQADGRTEIVIGGGVNQANLDAILSRMPRGDYPLGVHAYSGAQEDGRTTVDAVRRLVKTAQAQNAG